jgi:uncharacterized membrane protein
MMDKDRHDPGSVGADGPFRFPSALINSGPFKNVMHKARLEAFSDGVFAVAMTLLILDVRPDGHGLSGWEMFRHDWRHILIYILSFVIVGVYWVAHHHMMHFVTATDRAFLWINLLFLLIIVFIPYVAALLSASNADASAIRIYGASLILANLASSTLWFYASSNNRLTPKSLSPAFARLVLQINTAPVIVYAVAIFVAASNRFVSVVLYSLVPAFFILPNPFLAKRIARATTTQGAEGNE